MIGFIDVAISGLGFVAGIAVGVKLMSGKVLALQSQVDERTASPLCSTCKVKEELQSKGLDLKAVEEENRRLQRSNRQYLGMVKRLQAMRPSSGWRHDNA